MREWLFKMILMRISDDGLLVNLGAAMTFFLSCFCFCRDAQMGT
jgi:hypothetical protein